MVDIYTLSHTYIKKNKIKKEKKNKNFLHVEQGLHKSSDNDLIMAKVH